MSVYFIIHRDPHRGPDSPVPVKIGTAGDVRGRLSGMQTGNPVPLELAGWADGDEKEEAYLHEQFASSHIRGEWYALCADLEALIGLTDRDPGVLVRITERRLPVASVLGRGPGVRGIVAILDHIDIERLERRTGLDSGLVRRWAAGEKVGKEADGELRGSAVALGLKVFEEERRRKRRIQLPQLLGLGGAT